MQINRLIERFLRDHDLPPTKFGRLAVSDPRLVLDMRNGRVVRADTRARIEDFMQAYRKTSQ
jgi:hypothetical protein